MRTIILSSFSICSVQIPCYGRQPCPEPRCCAPLPPLLLSFLQAVASPSCLTAGLLVSTYKYVSASLLALLSVSASLLALLSVSPSSISALAMYPALVMCTGSLPHQAARSFLLSSDSLRGARAVYYCAVLDPLSII